MPSKRAVEDLKAGKISTKEKVYAVLKRFGKADTRTITRNIAKSIYAIRENLRILVKEGRIVKTKENGLNVYDLPKEAR